MADDTNAAERMHDRVSRNAALIYANNRHILTPLDAVRAALLIEKDTAQFVAEGWGKEAVDNYA